jgi:hypothetical protein
MSTVRPLNKLSGRLLKRLVTLLHPLAGIAATLEWSLCPVHILGRLNLRRALLVKLRWTYEGLDLGTD